MVSVAHPLIFHYSALSVHPGHAVVDVVVATKARQKAASHVVGQVNVYDAFLGMEFLLASVSQNLLRLL